MKTHLALVCAAGLALAGCNSPTAKTIGEVAGGSLPLACQAYAVAQGYFNAKKSVNSANNITIGTLANVTAATLCADPGHPPASVADVLIDLNTAWQALQHATTVPSIPPTPPPK